MRVIGASTPPTKARGGGGLEGDHRSSPDKDVYGLLRLAAFRSDTRPLGLI